MTATWTAPATYVDGVLIDAAELNLVRDNLEYMKARPIARVSDLDGTVLNTSSTSFVDVTGASVSITTSGSSRLLILASGTFTTPASVETIYVTAVVDGANVGDSSLGFANNVNNVSIPFSIVYLTTAAVSDGVHTVKLQARVTANTGSIEAFSLAVMEVY